MKNILLTCLLFLSSFPIVGQEFSFPQDSASWTYVHSFDPWTIPNFHTFEMFGDTIINEQHYKKITHSDCWGWTTSQIVYDFIRSEEDQVFFLQKDSTEEFLLYDFSLEAGDSFSIEKECLSDSGDSIFVQWVDSVLVLPDEYRKQINFNNAQWVEGIGVINHFLTVSTGLESLDYSVDLMCFSINGEYLINGAFYFNPDPEFGSGIHFGCDGVIDDVSNLDIKKSFVISPNPFFADFEIQCADFHEIQEIDLLSLSGQYIESLPLRPSQSLTGLVPGMYILKVKLKGTFYFLRRIKLS